ncbi:MAG: CcoQ/FixQ family Cbb3-type cytochrome c oxidase assembly chaperone, partial [Deltaproteobacteria bacterium]|nr:CcoQ/FixQ family Cbb3-type cytochrome c oxidase assembly chaperone [Deltaproteobacteria bacterium]
MSVRLGNADLLWLLWLVPLLVAFYVYAFRKKSLLLRRFAEAAMLARLTLVSPARQRLRAVLVVFA